MLDRFKFSGGVLSYSITKPIPKKVIEDCLIRAAKDATGHDQRVIRESRSYLGHVSEVSCTLFRVEKLPAFLETGAERDIKYCYALLVEMGNYLLVRKSGAADFGKLLDKYVKKVATQIVMGSLLEEGYNIEKLTAEAIDNVRSKVRKHTLEGDQLQNNISTLGSSNKILSNLQHKIGDRKISILGNSGRYNFRGEKGGINDFIRINLDTTQKFSSPVAQNDFLDNFASVLNLADHVNTIKPREILIAIPEVFDYVYEKENPAPKLYLEKGGVKHYLTESLTNYLGKMADVLEIVEDTTMAKPRYLIKNGIDSSLSLEHDTNHYYLKSNDWENVYLEFGDTESEGLQELINQHEWFSITFDSPNLHYASGRLCRDNKLLGNIPGFLQMFKPDPRLAAIKSEKGKLRKNAVRFPKDTLFEYVESNFGAGADHLILEDLGYEISDYIAVKKLLKTQAIHCKAAAKKLSASAFQEVVGQALKNLNFFSAAELLPEKAKAWKKNYSSSKIPRIRTADKKNVEKDVRSTLLATNADKEVILVVNFLSLTLLTTELNHLKAGKPAKKATVPLLWLLSSLKSSCLERNVKVYIYCKP
jgi:hypothetical protein